MNKTGADNGASRVNVIARGGAHWHSFSCLLLVRAFLVPTQLASQCLFLFLRLLHAREHGDEPFWERFTHGSLLFSTVLVS